MKSWFISGVPTTSVSRPIFPARSVDSPSDSDVDSDVDSVPLSEALESSVAGADEHPAIIETRSAKTKSSDSFFFIILSPLNLFLF